MSRRVATKNDDFVGFHIRAREGLRARLEAAAKAKGVTLTYELTERLERSLEADTAGTIQTAVADLQKLVGRLRKQVAA